VQHGDRETGRSFPVADATRGRELDLFGSLLDVGDEALYGRSEAGVVLFWNAAAERLFGYPADEVVGTTMNDFVPSEEPQTYLDLVAEAKAAGRLEDRMVSRRRKDGQIVRVSLAVAPVATERSWYAFAARDLTDCDERLNQVRRVEERNRHLVESVSLAVLIVATDGHIVYGNLLARKLFGYSTFELLDRSVDDLVPGTARAAARHAVLRAGYAAHPTTRHMGSGRDLRARRKDGTEVEVEIALSPFMSSGEQFISAVIADISDRKRLEQQLIVAQKMESVGRLADGIAHDFNNILSTVSGYAELLRPRVGADAQDDLDVISLAAKRAAVLSSQLLAFSRPNVTQVTSTGLNATITDLDVMLALTVGSLIRVVLSLQPDLHTIEVDKGHIEQILLNLVGNARDAMPDGGTLTIKTTTITIGRRVTDRRLGLLPGRYVALSVIDTGSGMDAETRARIFEPFFTTKPEGKGTGIGLPTVYGIVRLYGGLISVESEVGRGSTFVVYLPIGRTAVRPDGRVRPDHQTPPAPLDP
jgi:PAS domain S-box-containing protein